MNKITIYCEMNFKTHLLNDVSYELISKAVELKKQAKELSSNSIDYIVEAVVLGDEINEISIKKALDVGANKVVLIKEKSLNRFCQTIFSKCFIEYFNVNPSDIIIFPATVQGRIIAPRITTMLNTGLVADCTALELIEKNGEIKLAPTRPTFGAELMATILSKKSPQCATIRPNTFKAKFGQSVDGMFIEFVPSLYEETRIKLLKSLVNKNEEIEDFNNAKIVLAAGYGLAQGKDKEYFSKLQSIAKAIDAKIASTRKVVDFEFLPKNTQIGQTGSYVEADLYIAFGISGAIQHISGMKNCKKIVAINTDENADIFKYADYKIVADAKKIINEIYKTLSK